MSSSLPGQATSFEIKAGCCVKWNWNPEVGLLEAEAELLTGKKSALKSLAHLTLALMRAVAGIIKLRRHTGL